MKKIVLAIIGITCLYGIAYAEPGVFIRNITDGQAWQINTSSAGLTSDSRYDSKSSTATSGKFITPKVAGKSTVQKISFNPDYLRFYTVGSGVVLKSTGIFGKATVNLFDGQIQEFKFSIPISGQANDFEGRLPADTTVYYSATGVK